jgi:hypothetical protein
MWTPLNAFDAADTLLQMLQTHQAEPCVSGDLKLRGNRLAENPD